MLWSALRISSLAIRLNEAGLKSNCITGPNRDQLLNFNHGAMNQRWFSLHPKIWIRCEEEAWHFGAAKCRPYRRPFSLILFSAGKENWLNRIREVPKAFALFLS